MKIIMCVDDDAVISLSFTNQLQTALGDDYLVINTYSGSEALKQLECISSRGVTIYAVVSDWKMGGIDGNSLLQVINILYPKAITVLITAFENKCSPNIDGCFSKPVCIDSVVKLLLSKVK